MRILLFAASVFLIFAAGPAAQAQDVSANPDLKSCGTPEAYDLPTEDESFAFCDYYSRQFAYRDASVKLRAQMKERAENFARASRAVRAKHEKDMQDYYNSLFEAPAEQPQASAE